MSSQESLKEEIVGIDKEELDALCRNLARAHGGLSIIVMDKPESLSEILRQRGIETKDFPVSTAMENFPPTQQIRETLDQSSLEQKVLVINGVQVDERDIKTATGDYMTDTANRLAASLNMGGCHLPRQSRETGKTILIPVTPAMDGWLLRHAPDFRDRADHFDLYAKDK